MVTTRVFLQTLPDAVLKKLGLPGFRNSIFFLHQPSPDAPAASLEQRNHPAWGRIKFDELVAQQLSMRMHYRRRRSGSAPVLTATNTLTHALLESLPFALTDGQKKVVSEMSRDLGAVTQCNACCREMWEAEKRLLRPWLCYRLSKITARPR